MHAVAGVSNVTPSTLTMSKTDLKVQSPPASRDRKIFRQTLATGKM